MLEDARAKAKADYDVISDRMKLVTKKIIDLKATKETEMSTYEIIMEQC